MFIRLKIFNVFYLKLVDRRLELVWVAHRRVVDTEWYYRNEGVAVPVAY